VLDRRVISGPLRLLMCSPIGDGAAALVLASREGLERLDADPVRILAATMRSGRVKPAAEGAVTSAARAAYRSAGVTPQDVDVIERHDAAAPAELIVSEEIGLAEPGGGPALLRAGETSLHGRVPINPSGGLLSRGHPIGATGCAQLVEIVDQLRGRCARARSATPASGCPRTAAAGSARDPRWPRSPSSDADSRVTSP
jgi:acetyl-CoA acetyltransferase